MFERIRFERAVKKAGKYLGKIRKSNFYQDVSRLDQREVVKTILRDAGYCCIRLRERKGKNV